MNFYIKKNIANISFEDAEKLVKDKLQEVGFGIITEIDIKSTFKQKIDVDFRPYKILGACNPQFAHMALQKVDKIGVMLPCNVCLQQIDENTIEVFAINPLVAMQSVNSDEVNDLAYEIYERLNKVIESI